MKYKHLVPFAAAMLLVLSLASCRKDIRTDTRSADGSLNLTTKKGSNCPGVTMKVFARGFNNPRGLKFGPDGNLYVAEGGTGGKDSTRGMCTQVIPPVGPYLGSKTGGRISKVNAWGVRTTLVDNLPSSQTSPKLGKLVSGVADVAFIGNQLYALLAGAGCSHGVPSLPNGVVKVNPNGTWHLVANLSAYQQSHPVAHPEPDDFEPDGTWYGMISVRGSLYAVEPNHGEMVRIHPGGMVSRVIDISASQGHIVPTVVAFHGNFYVGNLHLFPIVAGSSKIFKITPSGQITVFATGFSTILGLVFDHEDNLYVLENTSVSGPGPMPGKGDIVRISPSGKKKVILTGLSLPTGMTLGPDGKLYVSNLGFGLPPGGGQVVQVDIQGADCDDDTQ